MEDKSAKILLDVPVEDGVLGFDNYRDALNSIIKSSEPHFTIGIFGGWGTGKTTLMKMMKKQLDDEREVTVWFNPWQYEKEEHLIVPLLQTIELELKDRKVAKGETIQKLGKSVLALVSGLSAQIPLVGVGMSAKDAIETYQNLFESKNLSSIYFDLNRQLSEIINELKTKKKDRIVIFIDDLDRCLPDKALQVLESIKTFLDMPGYVFVLGLSRDIIEKCVDAKYERESGISGSQYLRKIIQVPFTLPGLREKEMKQYVEKLKETISGSEVEKEVADYLNIVVEGMEPNPREIKRFINNFILVRRIGQNETDPAKLLAVLATQFRWEAFYADLAKYHESFPGQTAEIIKVTGELKTEETVDKAKEKWSLFDLIADHLKDEQLRSFLMGSGKILFEIRDFGPYIHFSKSVDLAEIPEAVTHVRRIKQQLKEELLDLLRSGKVNEFNSARPRPHVALGGARLTECNLEGVNLSGARLWGAQLMGANLSRAWLRNARLRRANLEDANLTEAHLSGADAKFANLTGAVLRHAELVGVSFADANLIGADLSAADLTTADLAGADLTNAIVDARTTFKDTIVTRVENLADGVREQLRIDKEDGLEKATSKWLLKKTKSKGRTTR